MSNIKEDARLIARRWPILYRIYKSLRRIVIGWPKYISDLIAFRSSSDVTGAILPVPINDLYPCLGDATSQTGFDRHYIYHTAWAARVLARLKPEKHIDVSSSLYFASIASATTPIEFYDFRPPRLELDGLGVSAGNITALPFADGSVHSLSSMHVVEHIGLGRYGDPLDPLGDAKAIEELKRVLAPSGYLLFVVPVGRPRVQFNAHRIYSLEQITSSFADLQLEEFALIPDGPDDGGIVMGASEEMVAMQNYACGCFLFRKEQ